MRGCDNTGKDFSPFLDYIHITSYIPFIFLLCRRSRTDSPTSFLFSERLQEKRIDFQMCIYTLPFVYGALVKFPIAQSFKWCYNESCAGAGYMYL